MIYVVASVELQAGTRERFLEELRALTPEVLREHGCLEYCGTVDAPSGLAAQGEVRADVVTIVEKWADMTALSAHSVAPHMKSYRQRVAAYVRKTSLQVLTPAWPAG